MVKAIEKRGIRVELTERVIETLRETRSRVEEIRVIDFGRQGR